MTNIEMPKITPCTKEESQTFYKLIDSKEYKDARKKVFSGFHILESITKQEIENNV